MAVLGAGGQLKLRRQPVNKSITFNETLVDFECNKIKGGPSWLWNGDQVSIIGLPTYCDGGVYPGNVDGYATFFGSKWFLGPNRSHISSETDRFYKTASESYPSGQSGDNANFYAKNGVGPVPEDCSGGDYWVHIDSAGWVSFYTNRCSAFAGAPEDRVDLAPIYGEIELTGYGTVDYQNGWWECVDGPCNGATSDYWYSDVVDDDDPTDSICDYAPTYDYPEAGTGDYDNADVQPRANTGFPGWQVICGLREWGLELTGDAVDTTAVSEKFGNAIKSLVNGGGNLEYFIDRECFEGSNDNAIMMMQLLLMTEKGCEAEAEFWMMDEALKDPPYCNKRIGGGLFYTANILITGTAVNVRPTELVAGSAKFVTTEEIRLRQSP